MPPTLAGDGVVRFLEDYFRGIAFLQTCRPEESPSHCPEFEAHAGSGAVLRSRLRTLRHHWSCCS